LVGGVKEVWLVWGVGNIPRGGKVWVFEKLPGGAHYRTSLSASQKRLWGTAVGSQPREKKDGSKEKRKGVRRFPKVGGEEKKKMGLA